MKQLMKNQVFGGALLIAGTTLGAGMLGFPTSTSFGGFVPSAIVFLLVWLVMLASAFFFLDANLSIKEPSNMVTMAEKRLGMWGKVLCWIVYLLLLYSLTAVYIAGSTELFVDTIKDLTGYTMPSWLAPFSLPIVFGGFIYAGTRGVDLVNRLLMFGLILAYFALVFFVPSQVNVDRLAHMDFPAILVAVPVIFTAFGYSIIIPSLSTYLKRDRKLLSRAIWIGSLIPIVVYLLWQVLVLGAVPMDLLADAYHKGTPATSALAKVLQHPFVILAAKFFTFFAIVTSFIGVTLSLSDFLRDGFKIKRTHTGRVIAILLTFIPPLFFVITYPRAFYLALEYAGLFVAILLVFLPAAMVWKLKAYQKKKLYVAFVIFLALLAVGVDIALQMGKLKYHV